MSQLSGFVSFLLFFIVTTASDDLHLTTNNDGYLTVIQGFAAEINCALSTCSPDVVWSKDDTILFNGTNFVKSPSLNEKSYKLQHSIEIDYEKGCSGTCDDSTPCALGTSCVDNQCCSCSKEEFTLILRNLSFEDSGRYKCQITNQSEQLEFQVEVLESGLKGGFHENISYDHSECCAKKGISSLCRAMCKPSDMAEHHFDPTSCKTDDYKNFLSCATDNGTRNHVHCCKTQLVPSFCYDFCSGDFKMLRRSHRLCLYYLPEIFECYNRAYRMLMNSPLQRFHNLPYPDPPEQVVVNAVEHDKLNVCWKPPPIHESNKNFPVVDYTVYYKEIPNFPLMGDDIGIPLLNGDYSEFGEIDDDNDYTESEATTEKPTERTRREDTSVLNLQPPTEKNFETKSLAVNLKRKRDTVVVMTRDETTNSTTIREFNFMHVNTTGTCYTITDLRASTRYIVYVTARNEYGTSVPSVRSVASTNVYMVKNNDSIPDVMSCCKLNKVSEFCRSKMCSVESSPNAFATVSIATTCRIEWPKVSPCLADGRNHTECCQRKGVQKDCMSICAGSTETLGVHSVLCLNLDLQAIYQCLREGYESHPSPPVNVTVTSVTESSAEISWAEPDANAHLVETYTLMIRKAEHGATVREVLPTKGAVLQVHNAVSPHTEIGLDPDSEYSVSVRSNSEKGQSLPSTAVLFYTKSNSKGVCPIGEPLLISEGRPFLCSTTNPCPFGFQCTDDNDEAFCCQKEGRNSNDDFQECCRHQKISTDCQPFCYFNATLPLNCRRELNKWVQCASEGRDHSRCCEKENVPKECLTGCRHPFQVKALFSCKCSMKMSSIGFLHKGTFKLTPKSYLVLTAFYDVIVVNVKVFANEALLLTADTKAESYRLENLSPNNEYRARVTSINEHGSSPPSFNVTFTTLPLKVSDGDRPKAPDGLSVVWNYGNRVNITWNPVTQRMDGSAIMNAVTYTLYYVEVEKTGQWTTMQTKNTWLVVNDLTRDALYSLYVMASENDKTSRSSSVITVLAQPDLLGLPEPVINISPDHLDGVYTQNDKIIINCSVPVDISKGHLNIDLTAGSHSTTNDHGVPWVADEVEADSSIDTVTCAVTDTDGRQNVVMRHLLVRFGPVAKMDKEKVRAFDDQSADITCTVKGFPSPAIRFEIEGRSVKGETRVKVIAMNTYRATLHLNNVTGKSGIYSCIAERNGSQSIDTSELIISRELLPVNPKLILSCCETERIEGDCLQACSIGKVPSVIKNCSQYAASLLKCATDVVDHSDCCSLRGVSSKCLPLCSGWLRVSGDSFSTDVDCTPFAVTIMECFVRGREGSPHPVRNVEYEVLEKGKLKVLLKWEDSDDGDTYRYYAVYYKKKDEEGEYKIEKLTERSVELRVEPDSAYDVGIISANAFGHSPLFRNFIYVFTFGFYNVSHHFGNHILGIIYLGRRRDLPAPFGKLVRRQQPTNGHATVAFENPAYVSGHEVEIRGLGGGDGMANGVDAEWQNQDLQASSVAEEYRNGMRYAKLESA
ncbi:DB module [Dictyocaulus viviparus]|uniref:DB module n=1 Tax=Dictyocaulus viviparus TaxID=29172 RepID=A0A0D8XXM3_DICVI|nr:DB module [Dictyocaulus viviparus]